MSATFFILALVTLIGAVGAMSMRNLVHCAVFLVGAFVGLAGLYLQLNAQFVGLVQLLVYVGAVAILIVFAILLTRSGDPDGRIGTVAWPLGIGIAMLVAGTFIGIILRTAQWSIAAADAPSAHITVKGIGTQLMTYYVLPFEVIGLLLTAALIGAVIIAMQDRGKEDGR